MHTTTWEDHNDEEAGHITMHHNGDYSGDVIFIINRGSPTLTVEIPFAALERLVGQKKQEEIISALEDLTPEEIIAKMKPALVIEP